MGTTVITGGTDGIGRALAAHLLRRGETVVVVGRSRAKFDSLPSGDAHFVAADLRLVRENQRVVTELRERFPVIDALVLAAAFVHRDRQLTEEGFEHTFALYYLSRHLLAAGLLPALAAAPRPVVLDATVPGAPKDAVRWDDLQLSRDFGWKVANLQSRRLGELSAQRLVTRPEAGALRYVLVNPGFVRTSHQGALSRPARAFVTLLARTLGTPPERAVTPLVALLDEPPAEPLTAYRGGKVVPLSTVDLADVERLHEVTDCLLTPLAR
ncbi:SDR family NAD(P)-dependent oxidoreductase [Actinophytocola sp.]|uniref:SDR family NAD(P)-dependent oxidoreductase n=1 Tax=Actinophytocola sp. TaxID=1872138 RepID=UPI002ED4AA4F